MSSTQSKWLRLAKEPLVHFVVIGAAVYLLFDSLGQPARNDALAEEDTIVVTEGEIEWLSEMWQKKWNRPPTDAELLGLVRDHLRETVLYREALAMGLDKDDVIIRRRMAQKLEFLAQDLITPKPPTEKELRTFFEQNRDGYRIPPLLTFTHVFLDPDKRGDDTLSDAEKLKAELKGNERIPDEASELGDRFMLQAYYPEKDEAGVARLFGSEFASSVFKLGPKEWHGPILSGYGTHLVYIHSRLESPPPTFEQVAERVREDWDSRRREKLNDEYIDSLLKRYKVVIEGGDDANEEQTAVKLRVNSEASQ